MINTKGEPTLQTLHDRKKKEQPPQETVEQIIDAEYNTTNRHQDNDEPGATSSSSSRSPTRSHQQPANNSSFLFLPAETDGPAPLLSGVLSQAGVQIDDDDPRDIERVLDAHAYDLARDDHFLRAHNVPERKYNEDSEEEHLDHHGREALLNAANNLGPHHDAEDGIKLAQGERVVQNYVLEGRFVEERLVEETLRKEEREVETTNVKLQTITEKQKKLIVGIKPYRVVEKVMEVPQVVVKERTKVKRVPVLEERVVEKPVIEVVEKFVEVPVVKYVTKEVEGPTTVMVEEKRVEVPKIIYEDRYIEIPKVIYDEKVFYEDRTEYREVIVDKIVEETVVKNRGVKKKVEQRVPVYIMDAATGRKADLSDLKTITEADAAEQKELAELQGLAASRTGAAALKAAGSVDAYGNAVLKTTETQEVSNIVEAPSVDFVDMPVVRRVPVPTYRLVFPDGRKRIVKGLPGYPQLPLPAGYAENVLGFHKGTQAQQQKAAPSVGGAPLPPNAQNLGYNAALHNTIRGPPSIDHQCSACGRTGTLKDYAMGNNPYRPSKLEGAEIPNFIGDHHYLRGPPNAHGKLNYNSIHPHLRHSSQMGGNVHEKPAGGVDRAALYYPEPPSSSEGGASKESALILGNPGAAGEFEELVFARTTTGPSAERRNKVDDGEADAADLPDDHLFYLAQQATSTARSRTQSGHQVMQNNYNAARIVDGSTGMQPLEAQYYPYLIQENERKAEVDKARKSTVVEQVAEEVLEPSWEDNLWSFIFA
ncbi:unnamed protein product [Amoebophrya sp. A120]|nr:unnamed protein product [Amoebophrya sp. A120]|eukprot:GSA120T00025003001.1